MRRAEIGDISFGAVVASVGGGIPTNDRIMLVSREEYDTKAKGWRVRFVVLRQTGRRDHDTITIGEDTAWLLVEEGDE